MPTRSYRWLLFSLAAVGLTADQVTKYRVFHWLDNGGQSASNGSFESNTVVNRWYHNHLTELNGGRYDLVSGWFGLIAEYVDRPKPDDGFVGALQTWSADKMPYVNHGALWGLGSGSASTANTVFACISLCAAVGILIWGMLRSTRSDGWLSAALGLILAGTVGNFYDRVVFGGVRDFLYFYKINFPVFNGADCCLVCGAAMLLIHAFFLAPPEAPKPAVEPPKPVEPAA